MEYEANEELYNIQDRRVLSGDYLNPHSLLNGTYDEREASESFKQAISEWRGSKTTPTQQNNKHNPKKVNFTNKTVSKDARIGTDQNTPRTNRFKELENQIHANHSLSYAERILLTNLRRNGVESRSSQVEVEEGLTSRTYETLIEEVPQLNSLRTSTVSLKHLPDPELIELGKSLNENPSNKRSDSFIGKIVEKKKVPTRPPSSLAPTTPRPSSSRVTSALRKSANKSSLSMVNQESNICRVPSSTLRNISMRQSNLDGLYKEENSVGEFLLLDVEKDNSNSDSNTTANKQDKKEAFKLSHKCKMNNF